MGTIPSLSKSHLKGSELGGERTFVWLALPLEAASNTLETLPFDNGGQAPGQGTPTECLGITGYSRMGFMLWGGRKATGEKEQSPGNV